MARESVARAFTRLATTLSGDASATGRLDANEEDFRKRYTSFAFWPSDAQLALHIIAWVIGPGFHFPEMRRALNRPLPDFAAAARASRIPDHGHPGVVTLNSVSYLLLVTANDVLDEGLDPSPVYGVPAGPDWHSGVER